MEISLDLAVNAIIAGLLLGGFYAAVTVGVTISFGMLDIVNIAHPAFIMLGSFVAYAINSTLHLDPVLIGVAMMPVFFLLGIGMYRFYYETFARRGANAELRGIAFFFGVSFVIEVVLILIFGVDQRMVEASYIGRGLSFGEVRMPMRMLVAFGMAIALTVCLALYLTKTFTGRAIRAVAQDEAALRLMGANPVRIKQWAFGLATAVSALAGALLIIVGPVEPSLDRIYIGRTFCVVVLAGLGSMTGTLLAGLTLGVSESIVLTMFGASWSQAVSFGLLLLVLGVRPQGMFGK